MTAPLRFFLAALALAALAARAEEPAGGPDQAAAPVSFHRDIRPIFQAHCAGCHQPARAKGGYALTDWERLFTAGESGMAPIVPGKPGESHLLAQITPVNGEAEMPYGKPPLRAPEIELVRRWIIEGALDDTPESARRRYDAGHPPVYSRPPVITSLDISPDGRRLAVAGHNEALIHELPDGRLVARLIGLSERIQSVAFSPDGRWLAAVGGQPGRMGEVQIWDLEKGGLRVSATVGFDTLYGASWSPDSRLVAFGCPDKTLRVIDAASGRQTLQQMAHEDWVLDTVFSVKGTHVISVGRDMTAKLTEVETQRFVDNITSITPGALRGGLQAVARHPTRDEALVGGADGQPQIYQVFRQAARKIGDNAALLRKFPETEGRIFAVDYSPDGRRIAVAASLDGRGYVHIYSADFDPVIPEALLAAYAKTSGEYTAEERAAIETFTTADVARLHRIEIPAATYALRFSPDGAQVIVGSADGQARVYEVESGELRRAFAVAPDSPPETPDAAPATTEHRLAADDRAEFESLPRSARVARLALEPREIRLRARNDLVQLVAIAELENGDRIDVTRAAAFEASSSGDGFAVEITPRGVVSARLHGSAPVRGEIVLTARIAGKSETARVMVDIEGAEYAADYIQDVSPVLSMLGCNAGACHGAREGRNGFKLSLRGYDPLFDARALTDDLAARRVNFASPDESLILLKATGAVPHEGGQRARPDSREIAILRQWIRNGAPLNLESPRVRRIEIFPNNPVIQAVGSKQQARVVATYGDGSTRDVTREAFVESGNTEVAAALGGGLIESVRRGEAPILARFEGNYAATTVTVMGDRSGFVWNDPPMNNRIDELVAAKWRRMKILPSDLCADAEFIRRVSLDLVGLPPTADEVREFIANPRDSRSKRDALIERLLHSPQFVDHWGNKWADLLQVNRKRLGEEGARLFRDWIRDQVAAGTPYNQFVREILTASGSNRENPPASYWKILRDPAEAMETTTHLFLGTRFNCNKCHDYPFERWTQDQYYELAQYFAQVKLTKDDKSGDRRIGGTAVEGSRPMFEIVSDATEGFVAHERTGKPVEPAFPFPAEGGEPVSGGEASLSRRQELAAWLTADSNRYFASSYVNRLWGYLLGVGLIEPLDDIRAGNPPTNPELLDHLTREFIESGYNTRHILRQICQSRVYQLSLATHRWNADDTQNYSHARARRLPAEVLLDSVYRVTGSVPNFPGAAPGIRAAQLIDSSVDLPSGFLANLGRPPRESACECERSNDLKLSSVMSLLSGPAVSSAIQDSGNALARLAQEMPDDRALAEELFLRILNRPATSSELETIREYTAALESEHQQLAKAVAAAEAQWEERRPVLERERERAMEAAEQDLATYLAESAAGRAAARRQRLERVASAEAAVSEGEAILDAELAAWEEKLDPQAADTLWVPLTPKSVSVGGSAKLEILPDGSVRSRASVGELPNFTVIAETRLKGVTGVKLEALPDAGLPRFGPGHKDGDFLLAEFVIEAAPLTNASAFARLTIAEGATDHIARGLDIAQTFNGVREQGRLEGWNIGDATGRPHWAAFALKEPAGAGEGTVLKFTLVHAYEAPHEIGRFRLWVTTSSSPLKEGLPSSLEAALKTSPERRSDAQRAELRSHVRGRVPDLLRRDFELELARKPLPADERLAELERALVRASRPVQLDPALAQLRRDLQTSERQLAHRRRTAAQDVAWALINTPSFLFNR